MFFVPMRSGITRWSICPAVSRVAMSVPRPWRRARPPFEMARVSRAHEGVVVGDDDLRAVEVAEHVGRHQLAVAVVAVRVVRLEHPQAIADGEARGDHQESARETAGCRDGAPR